MARQTGEYPSYVNDSRFWLWSAGVVKSLTEKEIEVLDLVIDGWCNKQISRKLHYSIDTVKERMGDCSAKLAPFAESVGVLDVTSRTGKAVIFGYANPRRIEEYGMWREEVRDVLSPRQLDVLKQVATGIGNPRAASLLGLSKFTVKTHVQQMLKRLGPSIEQIGLGPGDRTALSLVAVYAELLEPPTW